MALELTTILVYLSLLSIHPVSFTNAQGLARPGCTSTCDDITIPYPFGIGRKCYRDKGFEVFCTSPSEFNAARRFPDENNSSRRSPDGYNTSRLSSGRSILILGVTRTQVRELSLDQVRIRGPTISSCYDSKSGEERRTANMLLDLNRTPFTFSHTRNKFAAAGCDVFSSISVPNNSKLITGCVSLCHSKAINRDVMNASCSGIGCCQTSIPKGLKAFDLSVYSINTKTRSWASDSNACSFAALNDWASFPMLLNGSVEYAVNFTGNYSTATLDWVIDSASCQDIARNKSNSACIAANSECINSSNGPGYRCTCSRGHIGNPYLLHGCREMAPGRRLSRISASRESEVTEALNDAPRRRGKAQGLAVKNHKKMNNNQKPRVEFRRGLLKPVGPWATQFASEAGRLIRMNAPLACRNWKKMELKDKKELQDHILESFELDLHAPHVRRAVNRYIGQRLRGFRNKLYEHYKKIKPGQDKREHPHEDVQIADWVSMCTWFESDEFQMLSAKNKESRKNLTVNHCCGSKPFVRYREELKDPETQEEPGRIPMYEHTRFSKKKGCWVSREAEENYNAMNALQSAPTPAGSTPLTEDQVYSQVVGVRPGYVHGLGHGQDPLSASALSELENIEEAERRAEEAERRAQEAQMRFEESERRREESERRTEEKLRDMQAQMANFMSRFSNPTFMDLSHRILL